MKTTVAQLWKGLIPIRDVIVNRALDKHEDLMVEVGSKEVYTILYEQLKTPHRRLKVRDNYSDKMHELLYYRITKTKPEDRQNKLF